MYKNKLYLLLLAALTCFAYSSCSDDDTISGEGEDNPYREFMTMFRSERNGISTSDRYYSDVSGINDIQLYWYGINGAAGYRLKAIIQGRDFDNPYDCIVDTVVGPECLSLKLEDLQYKTGYRFAIQTLSSRGEAYNSKWFGVGDGAHPDDYLNITTLERYDVPDVIWVENITQNSMRISFNLISDGNYKEHFEEENGRYVMDQIKVEPSSDNPTLESKIINLTEADKQRGYVDVDGLVENAVYIVNGLNNKVKRYWDRLYNTNMVRMKGVVGEPILIKHFVDPNDTILAAKRLQACRIDTILRNYMSDNTLAEGTTFLLEGGKTYYLVNTVNMSKGFTLKSNDPNNRPTVYLGIGCFDLGKANDDDKGDPSSCNFSFGRNASNGEMGGINVQSIIFQDINFDCDKAYNYLTREKWGKGSGLGNYFINQSSQAMPFSLETFEVRNCNFRNMIRGWIRFQGPNRKLVDKFIIDNCLFYDCGVYDNNGRGYSWIDGGSTAKDANANSNIFKDFSMTNCTFINSPRHAMLSENGNLAWPASTTWKIRVENNTFINMSTRSKDRLMFEMRYAPANSTFICKNNLWVLTRKGDGDNRTLYNTGCRIERFNGQVFDFADNYSTLNPNIAAGKHKDDEIFTSYQFSATNRGPGYQQGAQNIQGMDQTRIHIGTNTLTPEELFVDPQPSGVNGEENMHHHNIEGFRYKDTEKVRNSDIYKMKVGDPRWWTNGKIK